MKNHPSTEIIICTRNNYVKLQETLDALAQLLPESIGIILVDQSTQKKNISFPKKLRIKHIVTPHQKGLGVARNVGIKNSKAEIICWTDDDCIVTDKYVQELQKIPSKMQFFINNRIAGICGKTVSYRSSKPSGSDVCPCTFSKQAPLVSGNNLTHWKYIGLGNNMITFRYIFNELGMFKEWLGPGSIGENGDDGEFMIRCKRNNYNFIYNCNLLIQHNKWLSKDKAHAQFRQYACGGIALYGFHYLSGYNLCKSDFIEEIKNMLTIVNQDIKRIIKRENLSIGFRDTTKDLFFLLKGLSLAFFYSTLQSNHKLKTRTSIK